jgi:hypothetical protein
LPFVAIRCLEQSKIERRKEPIIPRLVLWRLTLQGGPGRNERHDQSSRHRFPISMGSVKLLYYTVRMLTSFFDSVMQLIVETLKGLSLP